MKLDRAKSGLTLLQNFRLVANEPEATILFVRYISRPKRPLNPNWKYIEYQPGLMPFFDFKPMRLTVA